VQLIYTAKPKTETGFGFSKSITALVCIVFGRYDSGLFIRTDALFQWSTQCAWWAMMREQDDWRSFTTAPGAQSVMMDSTRLLLMLLASASASGNFFTARLCFLLEFRNLMINHAIAR